MTRKPQQKKFCPYCGERVVLSADKKILIKYDPTRRLENLVRQRAKLAARNALIKDPRVQALLEQIAAEQVILE